MATLYVCDTTALVEYFDNVFGRGSRLSEEGRAIITDALCTTPTSVRLSIPAVAFVEVFDKWCHVEEFSRKLWYEVYQRVKNSPNIEVKPIDQEVVESVLEIGGNLARHEIHDKIVLACAITLKCRLITSDREIRRYNMTHRVIPGVVY